MKARQIEIRKQANLSADRHTQLIGDWAEHRIGFINGADWADRTMIEKACEWLDNELPKYIFEGRDGKPYISVAMVDDFKKAMKGGEQ